MNRGRFLLFLTVGLSMVMVGVFTISAIAADVPQYYFVRHSVYPKRKKQPAALFSSFKTHRLCRWYS